MIRQGAKRDADEAVLLLRRSIAELCQADHEYDPIELASWLHNKTNAFWLEWVRRSDAIVLVAQMGAKIVGVGMISKDGKIQLNYVHPEARFQGVSKALLAAMEEAARTLGLHRCFLESTRTAQRFYTGCGYSRSTDATGDNEAFEKVITKSGS